MNYNNINLPKLSNHNAANKLTSATNIVISVELPESLLDYEKKVTSKLKGTIRRIALESKSFWKAEAGRKLKSSRNVYVKAINFQIVDSLSFYLDLNDPLAVAVEAGAKGFDLKPGYLKNAKKKKRKFPRALAAELPNKSLATQYRIIPLNVSRFVNMQKPKVFRTVTNLSKASSWMHPGWTGVNIASTVVDELNNTIVPKHLNILLSGI